jgi:phage protein D
MTVRKPILIVSGAKTANLVAVWGDALAKVTIRDEEGSESDECVLTFRVRPPFPAMPPKGTKYVVSVGWETSGMAKTGVYTVQRRSIRGDPESGHEMVVTCRSADLDGKARAIDSAHYDDKTFGEIVSAVAGAMGLSAVVAPKLRDLKIPYRVRLQQGGLDFLTDLADEHGGAVKVADGKIVVVERGSGKSASGASLPILNLFYSPSYEFEFDLEPRAEVDETEGEWWDDAKGKWVQEKSKTGKSGGRLRLPHPYASKDEAKRGAKAAAKERQRQTGSGRVQGPGDPAAVAGCPAKCSGYGPDADAQPWIAKAIEHDIDPGTGWITNYELEVKGEESD